ncbi:hypothetical protein FACS1894184_09670 [Clostridia bacterium]|nr:hypothetical protein FACS1894184_09670 [Clostridia bacterium]
MAIIDRGRRGYTRRGYTYSGGVRRGIDGAILPESARESVEAVADAVIPGKLPVVSLRKQAPLILIMCGVLCVFAFTLIAQMANCTSAAKEVSKLTSKIKEVRLDNEGLKREITDLDSGERIAREAVYTLGMVEPPNVLRYVTMPDIPDDPEPVTVQAQSDSWVTTALRALGGF